MSQNILEQNIARVLGIDALSEEEQAAFLAEIGDSIFETSVLRLVSALSADEQETLGLYLDSEPEPEVLLQYLLENYTDFQSILESVVMEYKDDASNE